MPRVCLEAPLPGEGGGGGDAEAEAETEGWFAAGDVANPAEAAKPAKARDALER